MRNLVLTLLLGLLGSYLLALDPSPQLQAKDGQWLLNGQPVEIVIKNQPGVPVLPPVPPPPTTPGGH